jgi:hypothetical protein
VQAGQVAQLALAVRTGQILFLVHCHQSVAVAVVTDQGQQETQVALVVVVLLQIAAAQQQQGKVKTVGRV